MLSYALGQVYNEESLEAAHAATGLAEGRGSAALASRRGTCKAVRCLFPSHTLHSPHLCLGGALWRPCAHAGGGHSVHLVLVLLLSSLQWFLLPGMG